jgi:hypothetical protein
MKMFFIVSMLFLIACGQSNEPFENAAVNNNQNNQNLVSDGNEIDTLPAFNEDIYKEYIPQKLAVFLSEKMPEWKIPAPNKWGKTNFNEFKTSNNLVNFVSGDFNCDRKTDYALILADKQENLSIWVFFSKKNSFEKIKLDDFGDISEEIGFGLSVLEPGTIKNDWTPKPVKINCQAIEEIYFEKASAAYYWDKGKFKTITTSD